MKTSSTKVNINSCIVSPPSHQEGGSNSWSMYHIGNQEPATTTLVTTTPQENPSVGGLENTFTTNNNTPTTFTTTSACSGPQKANTHQPCTNKIGVAASFTPSSSSRNEQGDSDTVSLQQQPLSADDGSNPKHHPHHQQQQPSSSSEEEPMVQVNALLTAVRFIPIHADADSSILVFSSLTNNKRRVHNSHGALPTNLQQQQRSDHDIMMLQTANIPDMSLCSAAQQQRAVGTSAGHSHWPPSSIPPPSVPHHRHLVGPTSSSGIATYGGSVDYYVGDCGDAFEMLLPQYAELTLEEDSPFHSDSSQKGGYVVQHPHVRNDDDGCTTSKSNPISPTAASGAHSTFKKASETVLCVGVNVTQDYQPPTVVGEEHLDINNQKAVTTANPNNHPPTTIIVPSMSSTYGNAEEDGIIPVAIIGVLPTHAPTTTTIDDASSSADEGDSNFGVGARKSFSLASGCGVLFSASLYNDVVSLKDSTSVLQATTAGLLNPGTPVLPPRHHHLCEDSCGWVHHHHEQQHQGGDITTLTANLPHDYNRHDLLPHYHQQGQGNNVCSNVGTATTHRHHLDFFDESASGSFMDGLVLPPLPQQQQLHRRNNNHPQGLTPAAPGTAASTICHEQRTSTPHHVSDDGEPPAVTFPLRPRHKGVLPPQPHSQDQSHNSSYHHDERSHHTDADQCHQNQLPRQINRGLPYWDSQRMTLVLGLDGVLIHTVSTIPTPTASANAVICISSNSSAQLHENVKVYYRPHLVEFIGTVAQHFDIAIFSTEEQDYVDALLDVMDPSGQVFPKSRRYYRQHCTKVVCSTAPAGAAEGEEPSHTTWLQTNPAGVTGTEKVLAKDLRVLGRPVNEVVLIDDTVQSGTLQPRNLLLLPAWTGDPSDSTLPELIDELLHIANSTDVFDTL